MQCYNSRCADEYAHQQSLESDLDDALEEVALDLLGELPAFVQDLIFIHAQKDFEFAKLYNAWIAEELNKRIDNDLEPTQ